MKRILISLIGVFILSQCMSQSIIPFDNRVERITFSKKLKFSDLDSVDYNKSLNDIGSNLGAQLAELEILKQNLISQINEKNTKDEDTTSENSALIELIGKIEKIKGELNNLNSTELLSLDALGNALVDSLNKLDRVKIFGIGGISDIQDYESIIGNFSFGAKFRLTDYKYKGNVIDPLHIYTMFNYRTAKSEDSTSLRKSILFPAIGRRDFVLGGIWEQQYLKSKIHVEWTAEWSLARFKDSTQVEDSDSYKQLEFVAQNILIGANAFSVFPINNNSRYMTFGLFPYYQAIMIDPKYWDNYGELLSEDHLAPTIHSVGLKTSVGIGGNITFCDMKYVMNNSNAVSPELKTLVFTIGTQIAF